MAASAYTLSDDDKRAIAAVLQEQRKGLEFLRNTLHTDVRHVQLMLEQVSGGAAVAYARGSTAQSLLPQAGNSGGHAGMAMGGDTTAGATAGNAGPAIDPLHGGGMGIGMGMGMGMGAVSSGAQQTAAMPNWGAGGVAPGAEIQSAIQHDASCVCNRSTVCRVCG